jgi:hypothetical protein
MIWADHLCRTFLFDAETRQMDIIPKLRKPKWTPFSVFVPNADADSDYDQDRFGSSLFVMERVPKPEGHRSTKLSEQFEAFVYRQPKMTTSKSWQCQLLPPPPYVRELKCWHNYGRPEIVSYALLGVSGDSHICISVEGVGTYCMDTGSHKWQKVGKLILPFHGRFEYVPELSSSTGLASTLGLGTWLLLTSLLLWTPSHSWWVLGRSFTFQRNGRNAKILNLSTWAVAGSAS